MTEAVIVNGPKLVEGQNDKEYAANVREELARALQGVIGILVKAYEERRIEVVFNIGPDWRGYPSLQRIQVSKRLD